MARIKDVARRRAAAFKAAEDDGLAPDLAEIDQPKALMGVPRRSSAILADAFWRWGRRR
jgi:hypothetical protein